MPVPRFAKLSMRFAVLLVLSLWAYCAPAEEPRELIYGAQISSPQEREDYRRSLAAAKGKQDRAQVRAQHRHRMRERAQARGVELTEPHGIVKPKAKR